MPTDPMTRMTEVTAQAIYETQRRPTSVPWAKVHEFLKERWRRHARVVLRAALPHLKETR